MSFLKSGKPVQTTGNNLVGLWRPSFVRVDHRLFVFGGGGNVTDEIHVLDLHTMRWETVKNTKGTAPCRRYGHTASLWNNYIIIFGGCNEHQDYCDDIHVFDIQSLIWFQPKINESVPARYLHSASVYDDKLFIYGGFAKNSGCSLCTYVLNDLCVLDLKTFKWTRYPGVPPRYNHSATLIGRKMYIYAGKDEHGNTISDLFVINLNAPPYTPHLVLSGSANSQMVLLKSQHFCEAVCGKLLVFGKYLTQQHNGIEYNSTYGLWMLDLETLVWEKQECNAHFEVGGWNYFAVVSERGINDLLFLGNTDPLRIQGYDHFRDALVINSETLGLYDIPVFGVSCEFSQLLNNPELSDFVIVPANGQALYVHQVILMTRWPHFRNIYNSGMIEATQRRMEIPEPYEVVLAFLKYLYNDRLEEEESCHIICDVLVMANMYLLHRLKKICCERLYRRHLSIENCGLILEKAITAEEIGLKTLALDYMFQNLGHVLKSDILLRMPVEIRTEFLNAVPENAVLEVHRRSTYSMNLSESAPVFSKHTNQLQPQYITRFHEQHYSSIERHYSNRSSIASSTTSLNDNNSHVILRSPQYQLSEEPSPNNTNTNLSTSSTAAVGVQ
ncbi:Kelch domain-containing protein 3 [Choanephora cucurbitarum]|uniref:Kelch domain-containing protein 3 n=1 Tax=Choanephora cucurbitarum TaxID=101091 RepID=A0A1C7NSB0_9FUNG|nr:Kelch domain-containing protein 3 [Choanephora cucurbitarum]